LGKWKEQENYVCKYTRLKRVRKRRNPLPLSIPFPYSAREGINKGIDKGRGRRSSSNKGEEESKKQERVRESTVMAFKPTSCFPYIRSKAQKESAKNNDE